MPEQTVSWVLACHVNDIEEEDVAPFDYEGKQYALYHTATGFYATDGLCTHEEEILADGLVLGEIIECPKHQGRFHIPSGKAKGAPVCIDLRTYATKVEGGHVYIGLPNLG
jgi:3-phenylpropionate/trans-cinnamate dioxygenase ferredoxin component